ncbi:MAG: hypothetical protein OZSIB_0462 [Candidatus Ozemobacter sibiricus]|jgi:hypothetical protein|uniref:Alpha/beta hydrolase n=1 Tax=Candidatus Ozemobacter sibiricus TaxID=2268124 RepID=A0A367ZNI9_9BACT|nr:MAG: hypothetical protein OZSIB_0462 [Candidatus Ozemobacter sibiricus]
MNGRAIVIGVVVLGLMAVAAVGAPPAPSEKPKKATPARPPSRRQSASPSLNPALAAATATAAMAATMVATMPATERTFVRALDTAPFPYEGKYADTQVDFFDAVDPQTGRRFHTNRYGQRFAEADHYRDASVLFHLSPGFDPSRPFSLVFFFHGNQSSASDSFRDFRLGEQLDRAGRNAVLIVPQLARQAADSSPGKFFRAGAFKAFLADVAATLAERCGAAHLERFRQAPLVLIGFSGGYKSVAYILDRGGATSRVKAVLLLDALYEDVDKFSAWLTRNPGRRAFVLLAGKGTSSASNGRALAHFLRQHGVATAKSWPTALGPDGIHVVETTTEHLKIPVAGPPTLPIASFLRALEVRTR